MTDVARTWCPNCGGEVEPAPNGLPGVLVCHRCKRGFRVTRWEEMPAPADRPQSADELDRWIDAHAADIAVDGVKLADMAPPEAVRCRAIFHERFATDGWIPALASAIEAAMRAGRPVRVIPRRPRPRGQA